MTDGVHPSRCAIITTVGPRMFMNVSEDRTVEFKRGLDLKRIIQTVASFANASGGTIHVGIDDMGHVMGVDVGKNTIEHLSNEIVQHTDPRQYPNIDVRNAGTKNTIEITVNESPNKPVLAYHVGYIRVGRSNHKISREQLVKFAKESQRYRWDGETCGVDISEIDGVKVHRFLSMAGSERRIDIPKDLSMEVALDNLSLLHEGAITNASVLLFGRDPQRHIHQSEVRCARFKGNDTMTFLDMKEFGGDIVSQVSEVMGFIQGHIRLNARIEGLERIERWEYPLKALREAIINAICHRDYEDPGNVQVRIFDDSIEIWSPGILPDAITPRMLEGTHRSIPPNERIANCLFLIGLIERWGTGTNRMIRECKEHGLPRPRFEEKAASFVVTFSLLAEDYLRSLGLNERQIKGMAYVKRNGRITNRQYTELNGISRNTSTIELRDLTEKGLLVHVGKGRGSLYKEV